eukprot:10337817-Lingulodinium_polyedra.AAC.1
MDSVLAGVLHQASYQHRTLPGRAVVGRHRVAQLIVAQVRSPLGPPLAEEDEGGSTLPAMGYTD